MMKKRLHACVVGSFLSIGLLGCGVSPADDGDNTRLKDSGEKSIPLNTEVYRTPEKLLADMPKEAYPKLGAEFGLERAATNRWLKDKLGPALKPIEWEATIQGVVIRGDGPFEVHLDTGQTTPPLLYEPYTSVSRGVWAFGESLSLGGQKCQVGIRAAPANVLKEGGRISYYGCTDAEAKMLRELKGKRVTLGGVVGGGFLAKEIETIEKGEFGFKRVPQADLTLINLNVQQVSVNGFIPAYSKFLASDTLIKRAIKDLEPGESQLDGAIYKTPDGKLLVEFSRTKASTYTCSFTVPSRDGKGIRHESGVKFVTPRDRSPLHVLGRRTQEWIVFVESSNRVWTFDGSKLYRFDFKDGDLVSKDSSDAPEIMKAAPEAVRDAISKGPK